MCQKFSFLLFAALLGVSCNKEIESVQTQPFSAFPNPCRGQLFFILDSSVPDFAGVTLHDRDGSILFTKPAFPSEVMVFQLEEEGIYYLEIVVDNQLFKEEILNLGQ